jgi:hypothetical protein
MVGLKHVYVEVGNRWNYSNKARLIGKGLVVSLEGSVKRELRDGVVVTVKVIKVY